VASSSSRCGEPRGLDEIADADRAGDARYVDEQVSGVAEAADAILVDRHVGAAVERELRRHVRPDAAKHTPRYARGSLS
jgi:hypothetical protein